MDIARLYDTRTKMLCLESGKFNDSDCNALCNILIIHPEIQWINLSGNIIGDLGADSLVSTLCGRNMTLLDLRGNFISDKVAERLLEKKFIKVSKNDFKSFQEYVEEMHDFSNNPFIEKISLDTYQRYLQEARERVAAAIERSLQNDKRAFEVEENHQKMIDDFRENLKKGPRYERLYHKVKEGWYHREIE